MNIKRLFSSQRIWQVLGISAAFLLQPAHAEKVVLGAPYSQYDGLYIVSTVPANDYIEALHTISNCENLRDAIGAVEIMELAGQPNDEMPRTVKLPPATYDCEDMPLNVPPGVTLEGSGQLETRIIGDGYYSNGTNDEFAGLIFRGNAVVYLSANAELYNLTVQTRENQNGGFTESTAVAVDAGGVLNHVTLLGYNGLEVLGNELQLNFEVDERAIVNHATISAYGGVNGQPTVAVNGSVAVYVNYGGALTVRNSVLASNGDVLIAEDLSKIPANNGNSSVVNISYSQIEGNVDAEGPFNCFSVHDEDLNERNGDCSSQEVL